MTQRFGQFKSEKFAEENEACRRIVFEINNFGINQRQRLFLIYLLSLEIENNEHMRTLTNVVRGLEADVFISPPSEESDNGQIIS